MSLLDLIRPQWKNSNPDVRAAAVQGLGAENQEIFIAVVQSDASVKVRQIAARKLTSFAVLRTLLQDVDSEIRQIASQKLQDEFARVLRNLEAPLNAETMSMLTELKSPQHMDDLLRNARSAEVRLQLVKRCNRAGQLSQVALRDSDEAVALTACNQLDREVQLQDVADHSRHPSVRSKASEILRRRNSQAPSSPSSANATPSEDPTLKPKRAAILTHAQRLLDTRDFLSNDSEFSAVVAESKVLGMGPLQSEFESVVAEFTDRVRGQREILEAEKRAIADRANRSVEQAELVNQMEALVNEGSGGDSDHQIQSLQSRWMQIGGDSNGELNRRFQSCVQRYTRQLQQNQQAQNAELSAQRQATIRQEIVDQFKLLLDKEDLDSVERQLRGLVREWETLPLLEGEDPTLQAYNRLRDQLSQRMRQQSESRMKEHEDKLAKLRGLIDRVQNMDENQDFKEISKSLRSTYLEWKDLVGDDKYQFHDIWKEYRAATARFEEMKEWESWRNEQEREHIIKEIESLLLVEDAADGMGRLRHWQQAWKDAGFVPQPKLQELWDRYKAITEKVMEKFHVFIEELNEQKQKNLDAKIEFCAEVERIVADTSDQWKEKARRVQQLQDEWKQAGPVPRDQNQPIWDRFRSVCDAFYALHKVYLAKEDGERQINLQRKLALCEQAEAIGESTDWNGTTNRLRKLQDEWKAIGPVPKLQSEQIWTRFRTACDTFFQQKRKHFDELDQEKVENLKKKVAICERLEALELDPSKSDTAAAIEAAETEWKSIGMVPKEDVEALWARFCGITDKYLEKKASSDPALQAELGRRAETKQSMIARVRELCADAGSNQASDAVRAMQEEWRELGRSGAAEQDLFHQFHQVCDEFFELRRDQMEIQEQARKNNLQRKYLLIEQAERILNSGELSEESLEEVKHLRRLWKEVGAVPREHSDKIWTRFNTACDAVFTAVRGERTVRA